MSNLLFDVRCAIRAVRKHGFGAAAILILALGIGANAALFSIANAILLRPLPYDAPGRLVTVWESNPGDATGRVPASAPSFVAWKEQSRTIERLAGFRPWGFVLTGSGEPERLPGVRASADLFAILGTRPIAGRTFTADEDRFGRHHVVVLSEGLWRRRFGADDRVIGRMLMLNGEGYTVVGVIPADTHLIEADVWVPLGLEPFALQQRGTRALTVVGRLAPGATLDAARQELRLLAAGRARQFADLQGWSVNVVSLMDHVVGNVRPTVVTVWVAVALVLLIACANTANLLLTRATARQQDVMVSLALGASRARIVRRLLIESVVLASAGGLAAIPLAFAGLRAFVAIAPAGVPRLTGVGIDLAVLAFTAIVSMLTGVAFGLVPALRSVRPQLSSSLRESAATVSGPRSIARSLALASQVALAVIVMIGAGLLARSFSGLLAVDLGFDPRQVLTMTVSLADAKYGDAARRAAFHDRLLERVGTAPGVVSAALASHPPIAGRRLMVDVAVEGRPHPASEPAMMVENLAVTPEFFQALRIPFRRGRTFTAADASGTAPVVIVNDGLAQRLWPGEDPVGRRLVIGATSGADSRPREVVGVSGDIRAAAIESAPGFQVYMPASQNPWATMTLLVRGEGDPAALAAPIRSAVQALDPDQPVFNVRTADEVLARALALRRLQVWVLTLFAAVGITLSAVGVYSVVAYAVRLRMREFGVRLALGAPRRGLVWLAIRGALAWAGGGIAVGCVLALSAGALIRGLLFGVTAADPFTFGSTIAATAIIVAAGGGLAARRAGSADPLIALRDR
jgi:putative ABC transport system permease protein